MRPQRVRDIFQALEAEFDDENLRARVTLIRPGMSGNRKLWTKEALKKASDSGFWNGSRMFIDHAQEQSNSTRVPTKKRRSMRDLVSGVESTAIADDGRVVGTVKFFDREFYDKAKLAKDFMGVSVDLLFEGREVREQGQQPYYAVENLVVNNSVDWVAFPAAGGGIDEFLTAREGENDVEWSDITPEMLRQHRPDLLPATEGVSGNPTPPPVSTGLNKDDVQKLLQEAREEWDKDRQTQASVRRQTESHIRAAKLPEKITARLIASFDGATSFDQEAVDNSIKQAREELEDAGVKPRVNAGVSTGGTDAPKPVPLTQVGSLNQTMASAFRVNRKSTEGGNE